MNHGHRQGHGMFTLEEATRRSWYNPEEILTSVGLKEGMTFADIGCGDGFFSLLATKIVGKTGKVYAVDANAQFIEILKSRAREQNITNLYADISQAEEYLPCHGCADIVFFSMVLHDFQDPAKVLTNARKIIKSNGLLVNLDWKKMKMDFGPPLDIRFSEHYAVTLIQNAGFKPKSNRHAGKYHYIITAKPAEPIF